jgi:hypothetical protein
VVGLTTQHHHPLQVKSKANIPLEHRLFLDWEQPYARDSPPHLSCGTQLGGTAELIGCSLRGWGPDRESNPTGCGGGRRLRGEGPVNEEFLNEQCIPPVLLKGLKTHMC